MMVSVGVINATVGARVIWVRGCVHNAAVILVVIVVDYVDDASWLTSFLHLHKHIILRQILVLIISFFHSKYWGSPNIFLL